MVEAFYMALASMKQCVLDKIKKLTLQTNKNGQYMHIRHVLFSQFNPSNTGKGMENYTKIMTIFSHRQTNQCHHGRIRDQSGKETSRQYSTTTGKTVLLPAITARTEGTGGTSINWSSAHRRVSSRP
jgi:hypothetical protein